MIDDDMDDREIFKMVVDDLDKPINCLYFTDREGHRGTILVIVGQII